MTYGIYESNNIKFYNLCKETRYLPAQKIKEKDDFNRDLKIQTVKYSGNN